MKKSSMLASTAHTCQFFPPKPAQTALLCPDTEYIAGMMIIVIRDIPAVYPNRSTENVTDETLKIHFASKVVSQIHHLILHKNNRKYLLSKIVDAVIIGGSSKSNYLEKKSIKSEGNFWCTYGMTETLSHEAIRKIYPEEQGNYLASYFHHPFIITSLPDDSKGEILLLMIEYDQAPDEKTMNEWNEMK
ncbi:MAG: hypothetical protein KBG26_02970, partial [Bacteroidales bacterium]|nr:hypothetical protein [Bacteroidales bacterium]HQI64395.1 hypothetical protein [Bacteroidales bacterium]HRC67150.1 hypothetical protein [Bacteroidales bacterium]